MITQEAIEPTSSSTITSCTGRLACSISSNMSSSLLGGAGSDGISTSGKAAAAALCSSSRIFIRTQPLCWILVVVEQAGGNGARLEGRSGQAGGAHLGLHQQHAVAPAAQRLA